MAKKALTSLLSGILGEEPQPQETVESEAVEITPEMETALEEKRRRNVGRPRKNATAKGSDEVRATFIVDPELIRKVKYISLVEGSLLKEVISEALTDYIDSWEAENGKIRLPKKK